ncbi:MAG: CHAP domain-containing protein [Nostoc sp.]|uniref:CHAP domain-containing protein n=1 Tax=Nostoc sp. TaxID=1180 RepID=UPI002FF7564D
MPAISSISLIINPARAEVYCQCTTYVANKFGLPGNYPNAADWNDGYLQRNGFIQVSPQAGAVAVMERSFPGADSTYGHVGILESISSSGQITLRGANQSVGSSYFNESGCNDVRLTGFARSINGRNDISFWKKGTITTEFHSVNFTAKAANTGVNIRSAASVNASVVGRFTPNQQISFDGWKYGDSVPDLWTNQPDRRWYRVAGTQNWVASAVVNGNAPGSTP